MATYGKKIESSRLAAVCEAAVGLLMRGDQYNSIRAFTEVLQQDDKMALAWNNRGIALMQTGNPFDAALNIQRAIDVEPNSAEYYNNLGACYFEMEDPDQALPIYEKALKLKPKFPHAHLNTGNALKFQGKLNESIEAYKRAVDADPNYADAQMNLAFALLMAGNYKEGWDKFEWRWKCGQMPERGLPYPTWNGEPLEGKKLMVYGEQGHGDSLQFIRYCTLVKQQYGGTVLMEVREPLARLAKTVPGIDQVLVYGELVPKDIDYTVPVMSLPRILGTTVDTIPWFGPYFTADPTRVAIWQKQLDVLQDGLRVGVCWSGMSRPGRPAAEKVDSKRSVSLADFAPLATVRGVKWVSLQKGPKSDEVKKPPVGMTIGDWTDLLDDFYDTAALIECLDLVITVDTAVAHVAAALGKPTWILSRWDGCWRWLKDREDTPWYPSVRLFNQPVPNAWNIVMETAAVALRQYVKENLKKAA